jgi:hypothetical protein
MAAQKHFPGSVPSDTYNDDDTHYDIAAAYDDDDWTWGLFLALWESYRVSFLFSLYVSSGFLRGGHVTHNLFSLPGLVSYL